MVHDTDPVKSLINKNKLFEEGIGTVHNMKVHIALQENVKPVYLKVRPVVYQRSQATC